MTRKSVSRSQSKPAAKPVASAADAKATTKLAILTDMMRRPTGATLADLTAATGWQAHSVRGAISGSVKKTLGLRVVSEKVDGVRRYSIAGGAA